jgi:hypothetical protein
MFNVIRTFTNELGNKISVGVEATTEDNQPRVKITLQGPESLSENIITPMEARELLSALWIHLGHEVFRNEGAS